MLNSGCFIWLMPPLRNKPRWHLSRVQLFQWIDPDIQMICKKKMGINQQFCFQLIPISVNRRVTQPANITMQCNRWIPGISGEGGLWAVGTWNCPDVQDWIYITGCTGLDVQDWIYRTGCTVLDVQAWMCSIGCTGLVVRDWMYRIEWTGLDIQFLTRQTYRIDVWLQEAKQTLCLLLTPYFIFSS